MARILRIEAADGKPVFWAGAAGQPFPDDGYGKANLSACTAKADAPDAFWHSPVDGEPAVRSRRFCALLRMAAGQGVRSFRRSILLFCVVCVVSARATEVIPPTPHDYFNDYAGIVGADAAQRLNGELAQFERDTSNQIVVAIFPRMQSDSSVGDYTVRVANAWGVGQKGKNNGAVLFAFMQEHGLYIQVGYGLEGALPNALCRQIIENEITPRFRKGDFIGGVTAGVEAMMAAARDEYRGTGLEAARAAQQKVQSEIAARSAAFVKANGVAHFVTVQQLAANPFIYQGQVVAIYGVFEQMNSATQGLFLSNDKAFVVSDIPTARFTQQRSMVMLAGRVLGNIKIELPVLGPTLVPHLSFVGSAFCQEQGGSDYDIRLK